MKPPFDPTPATPAGRVLLIEDNHDGREALRRLLEVWGYTVEVAEDGLQGIERARQVRPQVVIIDIGLPSCDGYQVAEQVRADLQDQVFLIALTGHSQPQERERGFACGFDIFLTKPADFDRLRRVLQGWQTFQTSRSREPV